MHIVIMHSIAEETTKLVRNHVHMVMLFCVQDGDTPLHYAARKGHEEVVKVLLEAGAIKDVRNEVRPGMCVPNKHAMRFTCR